MRHVLLGLADRIVGLEEVDEPGQTAGNESKVGGLHPAQILEYEVQEIIQPVVIDGEPAIHIGFARQERGIEEQAGMKFFVMKTHGDMRRLRYLELMAAAVGIYNSQPTA